MQDLWRLSAAELAGLIKSKKVSAKEAATAALARLDAVNPKINAVVDHKPAEVLAEAAAVDAKIARGEDPGMLAGVPVTVKVNVDQHGFATNNGPDPEGQDRERQQPCHRHLRTAGAVILGRTNSRRSPIAGSPITSFMATPKSRATRHHAGRLVGRRRRGGRRWHRRHRPWHRHCRLDPLSRLCLRRAWPEAVARPHRRL